MNYSTIDNGDLVYKEGKLLSIHKAFAKTHETPLKCIKVINTRYKLYSDSGFKGNSRDVQADYYVVDLNTNSILKIAPDNQAKAIIEWFSKGKDIGKKSNDFDPFEGI